MRTAGFATTGRRRRRSVPLPHHMIGQRYDRLTVVEYVGRKGHNHEWLCECECGNEKIVLGSNLSRGNTRSCGCLHREITGDAHRKHGHCGDRPSSEYTAYRSMLARCYDPNNISYKYYGPKGIKVCPQWLQDSEAGGFKQFLLDMGPKPSPKYSLERIDGSKDYGPANCKWATALEQSSNTSRNVYIEFDGRRMTMSAVARQAGIKLGTFRARLVRGLSIEQAVIPVGQK